MKVISVKTLLLILMVLWVASYTCIAEEPYDTQAEGKAQFTENCALCHGEDAKGDGVFAKLLTVDTPDLTLLKKQNDGVFPYKDVYLMIDGREEVLLHGPRYMPIWGDRFKTSTWTHVSEEHADTLVRGTIFELLMYLDSIQQN